MHAMATGGWQEVRSVQWSGAVSGRGGPEGDLMELNGWASLQMLHRYGTSARRSYDRIMDDST